VEETIWVDYDLPWTAREDADSALAQAAMLQNTPRLACRGTPRGGASYHLGGRAQPHISGLRGHDRNMRSAGLRTPAGPRLRTWV